MHRTGLSTALAALAAAPDHGAAWARVVELTREDVVKLTTRIAADPHLAADAQQEAFLRLARDAGSFRAQADPDEDARRWMVRVVVTTTLRLLRARRRSALRVDRRPPPVGQAPGDALERNEAAVAIHAEIARLAEPYRSAVVHRHLLERPLAELARDRGVPLATVKTHVHRGIDLLRRRLMRRGLAPALLPLGTADWLRPATTATASAGAAATSSGVTMSLKCAALAAIASMPILLSQDAAQPPHAANDPGTADASQPQPRDFLPGDREPLRRSGLSDADIDRLLARGQTMILPGDQDRVRLLGLSDADKDRLAHGKAVLVPGDRDRLRAFGLSAAAIDQVLARAEATTTSDHERRVDEGMVASGPSARTIAIPAGAAADVTGWIERRNARMTKLRADIESLADVGGDPAAHRERLRELVDHANHDLAEIDHARPKGMPEVGAAVSIGPDPALPIE